MAVKIIYSDGTNRVFSEAHGARLDGSAFIITKQPLGPDTPDIVETLPSEGIEKAEVRNDGILKSVVLGPKKKSP